MGSWKKCLWLSVLALMTVLGGTQTAKAQATASPDQYYAAGNQVYATHNYALAARYYYAAIKLNPSYGPAYQGLANCYFSLGRRADSLPIYQRASALEPQNAQLAQFVQALSAQVNASASAGSPMMGAGEGMGMAAADPMSQGVALFKQRQYAASIPYFQQATQQNPNDYRPYYYAAYAYYMMRDARDAALYFEVANMKQPNATLKSYADRIKATLSPDDDEWVDDQAAKYAGGSMAASSGAGNNGTAFGFHILGGMDEIFADPTQIVNGAKAANAAGMPVSLGGTTPSVVAIAGLEPFVQLGKDFEINLPIYYLPIGDLSYTYLSDMGNSVTPGSGSGYDYVYNTTVLSIGLGVKYLFGDHGVKGYLGLGGDLAPISTTFTKTPVDLNNNPEGTADPASGNYSTVAFGGHADLGVDFDLGNNISVGPYVGLQLLQATNFTNGSNKLVVNTSDGAVGNSISGSNSDPSMQAGSSTPLTLDYTAFQGGLHLTFAF